MKALHGERSPSWQGGKGTIGSHGYIVRSIKKRIVLEHRSVMEAHIGRPLAKHEVVHHINGIRTDNRIENLVLCKSNADHRSLHHGYGKRTQCVHCDQPEVAKGLCHTHYSRKRRGIPAERPIRHRQRHS